MDDKAYHKWIEISKKNLIHNINFIKGHLDNGTKLCSVIKANAYGHGLTEIAGTISECSDFIAVHEVKEAKTLLKNNFNKVPILLLGPIMPFDMKYALKNDLHLTVYDKSTISSLGRIALSINKTCRIHLKVDTGTSRQGILAEELESYLDFISRFRKLKLCGLSMHFANIEDTLDHSFAFKQLEIFNSLKERVHVRGYYPEYIHSACTAAVLLFPKTHFNMVRTGIGLYGLWPSREAFLSYKERKISMKGNLRPVLSFKTRIVQIKEVRENTAIGYGCSYITTRQTRIGVLPVGYSDGYLRCFGNRAFVIVNGRYCRVIGRVCMNLCMIDITDIPEPEMYDPVILIGSDGEARVSIESLADIAGTINYEIAALLNSSIERIIVDDI